jgi:BASS family bile acid:Na+ symporter
MPALQPLIPMILTLSLVALVLAAGLQAEPDDLLYLVRRPRLLLKAVLAVNVVAPVAAVAVLALMPGVSALSKVGILLMAASPVPPLAPGQQAKAGGRKAYSHGLYATMVVLSLVALPLAVEVLARVYGASVETPLDKVAASILATVVAPMAVGLAVRRFAPSLAARASALIGRLGVVLLLIAFLPLLVAAWPAVASLAGDGSYLAMFLVVAAALAGGHLLGGPDPQDRAALAVTAAIRHPGLALAVAGANMVDKGVAAVVLGFVIVQFLTAIAYQRVLKPRATRAAAA